MHFARSTNVDPRVIQSALLWLAMPFVILSTLAAGACAGEDESRDLDVRWGTAGPPGAPGALQAPAATPVPRPAMMAEREVVREVEVMKEVNVSEQGFAVASDPQAQIAVNDIVEGDAIDDSASSRREIAARQTERIIVRDAEVRIEAGDPVDVVDRIGEMATRRGGWVVNSVASQGSLFSITVRVPADQLDAAIEEVLRLSSKVISNTTNSRDFTEEFIDLNARIGTLQATRSALEELLRDSELADDLREILEVRQEMTEIEAQLEALEGRLRFISESAAYSKLSVRVEASPMSMVVDAGDEQRTPLGHSSGFTARFFPPEGFDRFRIEWDFGDGSGTVLADRAIRTGEADGSYLTAPVVHTYHGDQYSPYAVSVTVTAFSDDTRVAKGDDQLWVHAAELPQLNIFLGEREEATPGEAISFRATFDDHVGVGDLNYEWNFGDGSAPVTGVASDGTTAIDAVHAFERHQNRSYRVNFELSGDSVAGEIRQSAEIRVFITEPPTVDESTFEPGGAATQGANAVIAVASVAGNAAVWLGVTLPIWIVLGGISYGAYRGVAWWRRRLLSNGDEEPETPPDEA